MPPENFRFGGGADESVLHPIVLIAMLVAILLIFLLPRKYVIAPLLAIVFLTPLGQQLNAGGLHFTVMRIVILAGWLRMLIAKFSSSDGVFGNRLDRLDLVFTLWAICRAAAVILLFLVPTAAINQFGFLLDVIGGYFLLRYVIRDDEDIHRAIGVFAVVAFVASAGMIVERLRMVNLFGLLGGVRLEPEVRNGLIRAQGPFQHELLAGAFGATLLPLFFLLWKSGKSKILAVIGAVSATIMVLTSASSTPVLAYGAALMAICAWPLRKHMRLIRWGMVFGIILLNVIMKAPVWFAIAHIDVVGGSSGYHRAMLVNDFIVHFRDWWLIGTKDNPSWGFDMWDLCNQYVAEGETGGLITFLLFIAMISMGFSRLGNARKAVDGDRAKEWYYWLLGCALYSHVVAYFGISYFDQTRFSWFALLTMISAATAPCLAVKAALAKPAPASPAGLPALQPAYPSPSLARSAVPQRPKYQTQFKSRFSWARFDPQPK